MVAVRYNRPSTLTLNYIGGKHDRIDLNPGINLNFPESELPALRQHQVWAAMLESGEVEILLSEPTAEGELQGFSVTEDKESGQPMPIQDASVDKPIVQGQPQQEPPKTQVQVSAPETPPEALRVNLNSATQEQLEALPGIGRVTAKRIINSRPYESLELAKEASTLGDEIWAKVESLVTL